MASEANSVTSGESDGVLSRFLLERSGLRGVHVRLDAAWQAIRARANYPESVAALLGEATLFAECTSKGRLRGLARFEPPLPEPLDPQHFGEDAMLAITIENTLGAQREPQRYQGLVALDARSLAEAFEGYFGQSEQLPTRILLAADGERACGLILQQLPGASDEPDAWPRAQALFDTLTRAELLELPAETLLYRLFHEEGVRLLQQDALAFGCSCTRARVGGMLLSLGREEAFDSLQDGRVEVICEFCGQHYHFDPVDLEQLFAGGGSDPAGTVQ
jgi:molecular chaperone Hsp33